MKSVNKKNETVIVCIAIGLIAGGVLSASAQQQQDLGAERPDLGQQQQFGQQSDRTGVKTDAQRPDQPRKMTDEKYPDQQRLNTKTDSQPYGMQQGGSLRQKQPMTRASELLKKEVRGQDGKKLGDVEEIILSRDRRSVESIQISLDGGNSVKLPLDEVSAKYDDDNVLLVRASKQELQQRQTMDRDQARIGRQQDDQVSSRVSKLIGMDVRGTDGKDAGSIADLMIDTQSGRIKTAAIKTGGFLGMGTRLASVEWQQVNFATDGDTASVNMTRDNLSKRAQKESDFWDRHAVAGVPGQRERDLQQTGTRQRESDLQQTGMRQRESGMESRQQMDRIQGQDGTIDVTTKADNSARNVQDRKDATMTSFDQGNSKADTDTTAQIRKEITASEKMSASGKNVKVITKDGRVTLRGPVDSADEKRLIGEIANRIARSGNVDNQLEVKSITTSIK